VERHQATAEFLSWTLPGEIGSALHRRWTRGDLLATAVTGEAMFPMSVELRRPQAGALRSRPDEVNRWIRALEKESRASRGFGYDIIWADTATGPAGGPTRLPKSLIIPTWADAVQLIGKKDVADCFQLLVQRTLEVCPQLRVWLARNALRAVKCDSYWDHLLTLVSWFREHPRPNIYLRQVDLPGINLAFIVQHRRLIGELLNEVLPPDAIDHSAPAVRSFERRFGLLTPPPLVRVRLLGRDQALGGFTDVSVPVSQLATVPLPAACIFIVESEIDGLAFPGRENTAVLFGVSGEEEVLGDVAWLRDRAVFYWGDIDARGFARLDRLRSVFPEARSFLMDRETFLTHQPSWTPASYRHQSLSAFGRLSHDERSLYADLVNGGFGGQVGLDQVRISYSWLKHKLGELPV
jgi:hypothetical protein